MKPNKNWKLTAAAVVLSASLFGTVYPAAASEGAGTTASVGTSYYQLNSQLSVSVKSVLNESSPDGAQIGAVVRMKNGSGKAVRVPDYDVRVRTDDGMEYILQPSAANARSVKAREEIELSYLVSVDGMDSFEVTELAWVDVDVYVYPKQETDKLVVPVGDIQWTGSEAEITESGALKGWEDAFAIPSLKSPLVYKPVQYDLTYTEQGRAATVTFLVTNPGSSRETVPDFRIEGKGKDGNYAGQRVEQNALQIEPGGKSYLHYAIPLKENVTLESLNVLTPETFVTMDAKGQPAPLQYTIGRLNVLLPKQQNLPITSLPLYTPGSPVKLDPVSGLVPSNVDISMIELRMHENSGEGYKTAIAKFKVTNRGEIPVPVPPFQAELQSADGFRYAGTRQLTSTASIMPNLGYVFSYAFAIPATEDGSTLGLRLLDSVSAAPYKTTLGAVRVAATESTDDGDTMSFYPFQVKLNYWTISANIGQSMTGLPNYSYKMKLDLDLERTDTVVVDQNFSKMEIELVDSLGRTLGSETRSFTGANRIIDGQQTFTFADLRTEQLAYPITVNIYETIETPTGVAKRLVKTLKQ
ncbi:hypothetical protein J31TS4_36460 [Paenibacillus sp. J31TS4]|uniref:hypothetical protein n=1 Tax=Paenibacillus sp. J31TS4 TaxID=2807195 RepID=UPI001B2084CB|nr:hypothetical protein [Paenibacillus sp. J31TS4]GIP40366.1 hypothetical protein J31TS4_36460 [Paenibacillus sp. J31TS4]